VFSFSLLLSSIFHFPSSFIMTSIPNITETYFQHKVLTKIVGIPTYANLKILQDELKANASSVSSVLGGGHYGHLGLVLAPAQYLLLPNSAPWVAPPAPGPFLPPVGATGPQIAAAKEVWRASEKCFDLYHATSKALVSQVVDAVDPMHIRALVNRATGAYTTDLHLLLAHLFTSYGTVTPQEVEAQKTAITNMSYSIGTPVDVIFNAIDDLVDFAAHGRAPISPEQMEDLAYVVLSKERALQSDIRAWSKLPAVDKTWPLMVIYFRAAQTDLKNFPTAGDLYNANQANAAIMADLVAERLLAALPPDADPSIPAELFPATANAALLTREAALATRESALIVQMGELMALMRTGSRSGGANNNTNNNNNRNNNGGTNANRNNRSDSRRGGNRANSANVRTPLPRQYCWTHGYCAHGSGECNHQLPGHQVTAISTNMQGGSTANCFWLTPA
jgi:hypothetical protein